MPLLASGQISFGQVSVGVRGGFILATAAGGSFDFLEEFGVDKGYRIGISGGVFLDVPVLDMVSLQPGISLVQRGFKLSASESGYPVEQTMKTNYVEVPLLFKLQVPTEGDFSPHLLIGPAFGLKVGCKVSYAGEGDSGTDDCDHGDYDIDLKSFDLGAMIG